jgi:hypothetical protein
MTTTQILWGGRSIVRALDVAELASEPPASLWLIQLSACCGMLVGNGTSGRTFAIHDATIFARDDAAAVLRSWPAGDRAVAVALEGPGGILATAQGLLVKAFGVQRAAVEAERLAQAAAAIADLPLHWSDR